MISPRVILTVLFFCALAWYVYAKRGIMKAQDVLLPFIYLAMHRTTLGLKAMDSWAKKYPRTLHWAGMSGIAICFLSMIFVCFVLIKNIFGFFTKTEVVQGASIILPIKAKNVFYVPIEYYIICLFVILIVHEFSHGIIARR